ncbi:MAG TPA: Hsp70 family protein [Terriglobales bacterium]|nr:Hsp70 family protein [Terriglobales bacterium]
MAKAKKTWVGIDFGTTNSAIAIADKNTAIHMARFSLNDQLTENFRSVLYFEQVREGIRKHISALAGPEAIMRYLQAEQKGRLIQSLKSYLASRLLTSTTVFGKPYLLEELLAFLIRSLKEKSENSLGSLGTRAVVGRPVRFSGADTKKDDDYAVTRLRTAFTNAGFDDVTFEYEPIGAAYYYETRLDHDELILVADFGGGTSDFSLLQVGPSFRRTSANREIATDGVALAGDAFDAKLVRHLVSPLLGQGSSYKSIDKELQMPAWLYIKLERWHHLSFLKSKETMDQLKSLRAQAAEPDKIDSLIHLVNEDLGFYLHSAVQRTKLELSSQQGTTFFFKVPGISISSPVTRTEFEQWIKEELDAISECVDGLLERTNVDSKNVDKVFLTGGSSFVPAVRKIFAERFGSERLIAGDEFTSVAKGLALRALDLNAAA